MSEDNTKPRKLDDTVANYILQIEERLNELNDGKGDNEGDLDESRNILVENVLIELKTKTASALCDRRTNYFMEKICMIADVNGLLEILSRCVTYTIFLVRNRYSSHVLQV